MQAPIDDGFLRKIKFKFNIFVKINIMDKILKYSVLLLLFCLFICVSNAQETWDYPVKPGLEEWKNFTTSQQILGAVLIDQHNLSKTSSQIETVKRFLESYDNIEPTLFTEISKVISEL